MVRAGGIIVIFLDHLHAVQVEGGDLCKFKRVFGFEIILKDRSFCLLKTK